MLSIQGVLSTLRQLRQLFQNALTGTVHGVKRIVFFLWVATLAWEVGEMGTSSLIDYEVKVINLTLRFCYAFDNAAGLVAAVFRGKPYCERDRSIQITRWDIEEFIWMSMNE
jgi:hypothetical protein